MKQTDRNLSFPPALQQLKSISCKKAAPWIFAHYKKIYNFYPIIMKLGVNDHLMS